MDPLKSVSRNQLAMLPVGPVLGSRCKPRTGDDGGCMACALSADRASQPALSRPSVPRFGTWWRQCQNGEDRGRTGPKRRRGATVSVGYPAFPRSH